MPEDLYDTMGSERLANLALLHTHHDKHTDIDRIIDMYAQMHPRRIELETLNETFH